MSRGFGPLQDHVVVDGEQRAITIEYGGDFTGCVPGDNGVDGPEIADFEGRGNAVRNLTFKHFLESLQIKGPDTAVEGNTFLAHPCSDDALSTIEPEARDTLIRNNRFEGYLDKVYQMSYGSGTIEVNVFFDNAPTWAAECWC